MRLNSLANSQSFHDPIALNDANAQDLLRDLEMMMVIRAAEEKIGDMVTAGKIVCPCHLAIGQEAIAVGISSLLRPSDHVFGTHRSHAQFLALGGSVYKLFCEVLGKADGTSKGMGGSMHLYDRSIGFTGSVPIVGGTIPLAVGAALASQFNSKVNQDLGVCYFGDGAVEEGVFHESMNLAASMKLPVLFICENNLFSSHLHINLRQPSDSVARFAQAHCMKYEVIDGNDLVAVNRSASKLIQSARAGEGPVFLEAVTYRWRGHVGPREDNDVGVKRGEDLPQWKKRDPIYRLAQSLINHDVLTDQALLELKANIAEKIAHEWSLAEKSVDPVPQSLFDFVYQEESRA